MRRGAWVVGVIVVAIGALGWAYRGLGFRRVAPPRPASGTYTEAIDGYGEVLNAHVSPAGRVDYRGLADDPGSRAALDAFVASLAEHGPDSTPDAFESRDAQLAYFLNAYNALVLFAVREHPGIETVHAVRGWIEPTPGFGFFYGLSFRVDGGWTNLYDLENRVIRERFGDGRIHAAINCASGSCPTLRNAPFRSATLDAELEEVMRAFASDPRHVRVDDDAREVVLNPIWDWYRGDFEADARREGWGETLLEAVQGYASPEVADAVARARREEYGLRYPAYDWSLNGSWRSESPSDE